MKSNRRTIKRQNIIQLALSLLIIVLINIASSYIFTRFDLTSEKKYTLSPATKKLLKELDDIVFFKIYLEGDFPAGFKRLRNETKEILDEFRAYSKNIEYEFINPFEGHSKSEIRNIYNQLIEKGLEPTQLQIKKEEGASQQIIFPGAVVTYKGRDLPLQLLTGQIGSGPEQAINNNIQQLEYNISNIIRRHSIALKPTIAFIEGHGELDPIEVADISYALKEYYEVRRVRINYQLKALDGLDAIIIAQPDSMFDNKDKFIIDQFVMKGGKVLWLMDMVKAEMDSLRTRDETIAIPLNLNIDDMLFKYGVRINTNMVMDLNALPIPVVTGMIGNQPQQSLISWFYFPLIMPLEKHPIVKNLNAIKTEFVSTIDTVSAKMVNKTFLLRTSRYTRLINAPAIVKLDVLRKKPEEIEYNKPFQPIAVLLEGKFESIFKNRIPIEIAENKEIGFKDTSVNTKMIVISDGDIIRNQVDGRGGKSFPLPLGYDKYTRQTFGNKEFILNCMNYLCDDSELISVRARELTLRLLDRAKLSKAKNTIILINLVIPVLLVLGFGILQFILRKRKYSKTIKK